METKNEEVRGFLEDLKIRNDKVADLNHAKQLSAERLISELD